MREKLENTNASPIGLKPVTKNNNTATLLVFSINSCRLFNLKPNFSIILVELVKWRQVCPDFLVRTLKVTADSTERTVCQFHYQTWPDHGVPTSVHPILELVRLMRDVQASETRPILIHCSAGCGRTGTICSIDYVWALLRTGKLKEGLYCR